MDSALRKTSAQVAKSDNLLTAIIEETVDPDELRSQVTNTLLAGRDTTASLLTWFFLLMSDTKHKNFMEKLRHDIVEQFGTFDHPKNISLEGLQSCQYLQWCLKEALRLFPPVPLNTREAIIDTTLPRGGGQDGLGPIFIPKGSHITYSVSSPLSILK